MTSQPAASRRRALPRAALTLPLFAALPLQAQDVALDLTGEIEVACTLETVGAAGRTIALADGAAGSTTIDLAVDCNVPFSYTIESEHGGFRNAAAEAFASADGITLIPYDVTITIDGLSAAGMAPATTTSAEMALANGGFTAGSGSVVVFASAGDLVLDWDTSGQNLYAGDYTDTITLTIDGDAAAALTN